MLKTSHLITQGFGENITAQDKLFKQMCNFGAQSEWREGRIFFSYYLDVETRNNQCCPLNHTPLVCIAGYIMEDYVGDMALKRLP